MFSNSEREETILALMPLAKGVARKEYQRRRMWSGRVEFCDFEQVAIVSLIRAVDTFRDGTGMTLTSYAYDKICWGLVDYLRSTDLVSRTHRKALLADGESGPLNVNMGAAEKIGTWPDYSDTEIRADVQSVLRLAVLTSGQRAAVHGALRGEDRCVTAKSMGLTPARVSQLYIAAVKHMTIAARERQ